MQSMMSVCNHKDIDSGGFGGVPVPTCIASLRPLWHVVSDIAVIAA